MAHFVQGYLNDEEAIRTELTKIVEQYLYENFSDLYNHEAKEWKPIYVSNWYRMLPFTPGADGYSRALGLLKYLKNTDDSSAEMLKHVFNNSGWNRLFGKFIESVYKNTEANKQIFSSFSKTASRILVDKEKEQISRVKNAIQGSLKEPKELVTLSEMHNKRPKVVTS